VADNVALAVRQAGKIIDTDWSLWAKREAMAIDPTATTWSCSAVAPAA
jgi:hypothetical protein